MAVKTAGATYENIMRDLKQGKYAPIYILMGEESFYIDRITDFIAENALTPAERDFNQDIVFGADVKPAQIIDMARQYPMMSQRRVVIVKESQALRGVDVLEPYFLKPAASTVLVFCHKNGTVDRRKKIMTLAQSVGVVFESKKKKPQELPAFITEYLRSKGAAIDPKSAYIIADHIGADLNRLVSELDKLLISLPADNRRVTPEVVEREVGVSKDFNVFELRDAVINKNVFKANQIMKYFDSNPKSGSPYTAIPLLFSYFQNLMLAYYAPNRNNPTALAQFLGLKNSWGVKDYITGMRNFSGVKTMAIISKFREVDAKSKGLDNSSTSIGDLAKELLFFIMH